MPAYLCTILLLFVASLPLSAQAIGDEAPNKAFITTWNMPAEINEVTDYRDSGGNGRVLLLDFFGVYCGHCISSVTRLNDLQFRYGGRGLEVVTVNFANTDAEIETFRLAYDARFGLARIADSSGYTVPIFSWLFAIDHNGKVLWSGMNDQVTDAMVESWLAASLTASEGAEDKSESRGCTLREDTRYSGLNMSVAVMAMFCCLVLSRRVFFSSHFPTRG